MTYISMFRFSMSRYGSTQDPRRSPNEQIRLGNKTTKHCPNDNLCLGVAGCRHPIVWGSRPTLSGPILNRMKHVSDLNDASIASFIIQTTPLPRIHRLAPAKVVLMRPHLGCFLNSPQVFYALRTSSIEVWQLIHKLGFIQGLILNTSQRGVSNSNFLHLESQVWIFYEIILINEICYFQCYVMI